MQTHKETFHDNLIDLLNNSSLSVKRAFLKGEYTSNETKYGRFSLSLNNLVSYYEYCCHTKADSAIYCFTDGKEVIYISFKGYWDYRDCYVFTGLSEVTPKERTIIYYEDVI